MVNKRKQYEPRQLELAISAVKQKRMKLRVAAGEFNIPRSTLSDHLKGNSKGGRPGPSPELTTEEEQGLVNYLMYMANQGFPLSRDMTRCFVRDIIKTSGRETTINLTTGPSDGWFQRFVKRHPDMSARKPENLDKARANMSTQQVMDQYFDLLTDTLETHGLKNKPSQIFNCDETGFSGKEMPRARVFGPKGQHVFRRKTATSDHVTAHLCVCADGRFLPSFVIYQGSVPHRNFTDGIPDSWLFGYSDSGYMDRELFNNWFSKLFLSHCGRERPVVLIMDNHDSHISIPIIELARANGVILVGLPAHTTHILQPLDVKIIGPLKERYTAMAANLGQTSASMVIGKARFPLLLKYAIDKASPASITEAFSATGSYPLNPSAIDQSQIITPTTDKSIQDESGNSEANTSCPTCGSRLINPLVAHGLIPQSLASILVPPPSDPKPQKRNRRVVSTARVLSGAEMLEQLKAKEELEQKQIEDRDRRKVEVVRKREEKQHLEEDRKTRRQQLKDERQNRKEAEEEQKRQRKETRENMRKEKEREREETRKKKSKSSAEVIAARMYVCDVCGVEGRSIDEGLGIVWYGCDEESCGRWFHDGCLSRREIELIVESLDDNGNWYCQKCKPWLYLEE